MHTDLILVRKFNYKNIKAIFTELNLDEIKNTIPMNSINITDIRSVLMHVII